MSGELPENWDDDLRAFKRRLVDEAPAWASRQSSQKVLEVVNPAVPETVGGSADLTGSNNTRTGTLDPMSADNYGGRYIHYGVREHAMGAVMNGMALHGGVVPYGGTFLVFTDYLRPALRLSALMGKRTIHVMTHDSIGLGEDGPTHQPVEHLASLRAIPNLAVFRPADAVETAECWALALTRTEGPSVIALTRQGLPPARTGHSEPNLCAGGAYELSPATGGARVTVIATGSETAIALEARSKLEEDGIPTRVVSMPCQELFDERPRAERDGILRPDTVRIAIEAAAPPRLGALCRRRGRRDRHGVVRGLRAGQGTVPALRSHRGSDRGRRQGANLLTSPNIFHGGHSWQCVSPSTVSDGSAGTY